MKPALRRSPWPYAIIGFFVVFVTFVAVFITWAVRQEMDLVGSDYYEREIRHQDQIDRLKRTIEFKGEADARYDAGSSRIIVRLPAAHAAAAKGAIQLYRPSDAKLDREVPLALDAKGVQWIGTGRLRDGLWKIRVRWAANGEEYFFERPLVISGG
jgi:nitrogen fixation protein FixH